MIKTNTFFKILIGVVIVLLVGGIIFGTIALINKNDSDKDEITNTESAETIIGDVSTTDTTDGSPQLLYSGQIYAMPKMMTFSQVSALSETASEGITVNATIKPDTAVNKKVNWQVTWENPNETFASGKTATEYISVTPLAEGSSTATITCLQPFGSTVQVSVISEANPGVYATLTVDYEKRVIDITAITTNEDYTFNGTTLYLHDTSNWKNNEKYYTHDWLFTYAYSVGSVDATEVVSTSCYIKASDELATAYSTAPTEYVHTLKNHNALLENGLGIELYKQVIDKTQEPFEQVEASGEVTLVWPTISVFNSIQWNTIVATLSSLEGHAFDLKIVATTKSGNDSEIILPIYIDAESIGAQVESITVDQTNIVM